MSVDFAISKTTRLVGATLLLAALLASLWWWSIRIERAAKGTPAFTPNSQAPQLPGDKRVAAWTQQLQMHLVKQPDDVASWRLLAQAHATRGDMAQSAAAWQRALALTPQHADSHAGLAQALAARQQGRLRGEPAKWIESGLKVAADHPALLALAGELAVEEGRVDQARVYFERLLQAEQARAADAARLNAIRTRLAEVAAAKS